MYHSKQAAVLRKTDKIVSYAAEYPHGTSCLGDITNPKNPHLTRVQAR